MAKQKEKMKFPVKVLVLLALTFVMGSLTGVVLYATGATVVKTPHIEMVSHTEYAFNAPGQIIARITDFQGNPIAVTSCNATILYPNKDYFVSMAGMTPSGNISGDFYYGFTTPAGPEGTYEYQATCFYGVGKNASITNSFHLTGNLNAIQGNLTVVSNNLTAIQGNLTALSAQVSSMNASLASQISGLSSQLTQNTSYAITQIQNVNSTLYTQTQNIQTTLAGMNTNYSANFSQVLAAIQAINVTGMNYTQDFQNVQSNFSLVFTDLAQINATANNAYSAIGAVNVTTVNTYSYMTGTLTNKIDDALLQLGIINATVNRIETNTQQINATTNAIKDDLENQVFMQVSSG